MHITGYSFVLDGTSCPRRERRTHYFKKLLGQRARVILADQESGWLIPDYCRDCARTGSDYWNARGHGFHRRDPEAFVPDRRKRENIGIVIEINQLRARYETEKSNLAACLC